MTLKQMIKIIEGSSSWPEVVEKSGYSRQGIWKMLRNNGYRVEQSSKFKVVKRV